ncbi:MAG: ArsR family transcriptional regulator [Planctomycetes bacterium]|nr:ArsR family transcriptional regulator [Planctomycetota bacterium]
MVKIIMFLFENEKCISDIANHLGSKPWRLFGLYCKNSIKIRLTDVK